MDELASSYPQTVNGLRKSEIKLRRKKEIPPPKYLCMPGSLAFIDKIPIIDRSHTLCNKIKCIFQNNDIDVELQKLQIPQIASNNDNTHSESDGVGNLPKIGKLRRLLKKKTKHEWLEVSDRNVFWSHVLLGSNEIIRRLENYSRSVENSQIDGKKISCVFIDSGWLQSQYVHHLVNLCDLLNIRLISVKPSGCLPELVTTKLKEVKKLAVFAFCTSNEAPSDLLDIFRLLDTLFSPCVGNTERKTPLFEVNDRHPNNSSIVEPRKSWEDVQISPELYTCSSMVHEFTLHEFQPYISSLIQKPCNNNDDDDTTYDTLSNTTLHSHLYNGNPGLQQYQSPSLKTVVAQTVDQRANRKVKRYKKVKNSKTGKKAQSSLVSVKRKKKKKMLKITNKNPE
ncbi:unnamed protein product [Trichobilharzia szidati]|nr:unnamed protein product [Trichobilharzia szidati]